eukprot:7101697-Prymnesium_polylepis.1
MAGTAPPRPCAAAACAVAAAAEGSGEATMAHDEHDEQPTSAELRVAAAAAPHKQRVVAAGTAVGVVVGEGGKPPVGGEGKWTTRLCRGGRGGRSGDLGRFPMDPAVHPSNHLPRCTNRNQVVSNFIRNNC